MEGREEGEIVSGTPPTSHMGGAKFKVRVDYTSHMVSSLRST